MNSTKDIKELTVAFTGHRTYRGEGNDELRELLEQLYRDGFRRFLCGMAWGWDLAAAEAVVELKSRYHDVELVAVKPYAAFQNLFSGEDFQQFSRVEQSADEVRVTGEYDGPCDMAFRQRNDYLVENSAIVVAWWNGIPRGGTAYTLRQARHKNIPIINLMPDIQLKLDI